MPPPSIHLQIAETIKTDNKDCIQFMEKLISLKLTNLMLVKMEGLSSPAIDIIGERNVVAFKEDLYHDGYDEQGPKSDLWDLYIISLEHGKYIYYNYHWENWFSPLDEHIYELHYTSPVDKLPPTSFHLQIAETIKTDNEDYIKFREKLK